MTAMKKIALSILTLLLSAVSAMAVPATPYPVKYRQPDGTIIELRIHGDEFFSWTTLAGSSQVMERAADGFWRASSINPSLMITVGLCFSNALTGLAGCLIGQYNKTCDINLGTGMVTVALASLVIGETISGKRRMTRRIFCVVLGSCLYRMIISIALRLNVPTEAFKLVSALIVCIAIAAPQARKMVGFQARKAAAVYSRRRSVPGGDQNAEN